MNKFLFILLLISSTVAAQNDKFFVSGCGWLQVALVDRNTKQIEWTYDLMPGEDCENITLTRKGDLLISYGRGAKLISSEGKTIWDYPVDGGSELFSAIQLADGGFLLAHSGHPAKMVELDKKGRTRKIVAFDTDIENRHAQIRQVIKSSEGTYLIPLMGKGEVVELDQKGNELLRFKVEGNPFSVLELNNGNILVSCGDAHIAMEVERKTGKPVGTIRRNEFDGVLLNFVAQIVETENNTRLICNWNGHARGKDAEQPALLEVNNENRLVWSLEEGAGIGRISCVYPVSDNKHISRYIAKNKQ
jgi:hypothetical protein